MTRQRKIASSSSRLFRLLASVALLFSTSLAAARAQHRTGPENLSASAAEERQPSADLGDGLYRNPVIAGNYADVAAVRVGADYYLVNCCGDPRGLLVWHSQDLVNWKALSRIEVAVPGHIWAPDLVYRKGLFYLFLPMMSPGTGSVWAMSAKSMEGPWSKPVNLGLHGIDPGFIADQSGAPYLYVDAGRVAKLAPDLLGGAGDLVKVYEGWHYPSDWVVECFCLEAPKLIHRGEYFYLVSAQGGTEGPSTSHMAVVARSRAVTGPWEDSPYNPLIHTNRRSERWWSQGHGVLLDDVNGNWWMLYHAIENGYRSLGRQTLLLPIEWTADSWPRVKPGATSTSALQKPTGRNSGSGMALSDKFRGSHMGLQWNYAGIPNPDESIHLDQGALILQGSGETVRDAPMLYEQPTNHAYEAQVQVEASEGGEAGLVLASGNTGRSGAVLKKGEIDMCVQGRTQLKLPWKQNSAFFKIVNDRHDFSVYYSEDGAEWHRFDFGLQLDGSQTDHIGLIAAGTGASRFHDFEYHGMDGDPEDADYAGR